MSGHSKWSTIKRKKGAIDAKRGKLFTKLLKEVSVAARIGGGDESANPRLRAAVATAKSNSVPKANIQRAIDKATSSGDGEDFEECVYEGYGPGGVSILVECLTDNRNRTAPNIRYVFNKKGGSMGAPGSAAYNFDRRGRLTVAGSEEIEDELTEAVLEAGGDDLSHSDESWEIFCDPSELYAVRDGLESAGYAIGECGLTMVPKLNVTVGLDEGRKLLVLIESLEDDDDVQNVYSNFEFSPEDMATLAAEG